MCEADPPVATSPVASDGIPLDKPNIVVIQFDDLGFADFQMMRFGVARTPWISRISREGMAAERYFTGASVCSPSRYSMATGRSNAEDGIFTTISPLEPDNLLYNNSSGIPAGLPTIYSELKNQLGYKTAHHGKWHMGLDDTLSSQFAYGLDEYSGWAFHDPGTPDVNDRALQTGDRFAWESTRDSLMAGRSCDFIRASADNGDPFFLNISFHSPHTPLYPSAAGMAAVAHLEGSPFFNSLDPNDPRVTSAQRYYASIWDTDQLIGSIYQCLQQRSVLDNTILIITSDNGPLTNRNFVGNPDQWGRTGSFRGMKNSVFNGGIRVPFVARGPSIPAGYVPEKATITTVDIMPTLIHMAGGVVPSGVDGEVMTAQLQGEDIDRTQIFHWLTIQNQGGISDDVADRSPTIRGYYPAGTIGNNNPMNVYTNEIGNLYTRQPLIYNNEDHTELDNLYYLMSRTCGNLRDRLIDANQAWYDTLPNPRNRPGAGRLEHRL